MKVRPALHPATHAFRAGFTLLEMMVVIGIIGLLSAFLLPTVVESLGSATVAADEANMRELHRWLVMYQTANNGNLPTESGQKFILKLWKDSTIERSAKNAKRFFSAGEGYDSYTGLSPDEFPVEDYLTDWDSIGPGYINYAAFDPQGDRSLRRKLKTNASKVTIVANATFAHRNDIVYMTADGEVHRLNVQNLLDDGILTQDDVESGIVPVGQGSPIEQLRTVTND